MTRVLLTVFGIAVALLADDSSKVVVKMLDGNSVELRTPEGWTTKQSPPSDRIPPSLQIVSKAREASLQVTFIPDKDGKFAAQKDLDELVNKIGGIQYAAGSVEKKVTPKSLESKHGLSSFAEFTDADWVGKDAPSGKYKVVGSGVLKIGGSIATFTLMGAAFDDAQYLAGKKIITEAALSEK